MEVFPSLLTHTLALFPKFTEVSVLIFYDPSLCKFLFSIYPWKNKSKSVTFEMRPSKCLTNAESMSSMSCSSPFLLLICYWVDHIQFLRFPVLLGILSLRIVDWYLGKLQVSPNDCEEEISFTKSEDEIFIGYWNHIMSLHSQICIIYCFSLLLLYIFPNASAEPVVLKLTFANSTACDSRGWFFVKLL